MNNITYFQRCKGDLNVPTYRQKCYKDMEQRMESVMDRYVRDATEKERKRQHTQCMLLKTLDDEFYKKIHKRSRDVVE